MDVEDSPSLESDINLAVKYVIRENKKMITHANNFYNPEAEHHETILKLDKIGFFKMLIGASIVKFYEQYRNSDENLYINETDKHGDDPMMIRYRPITEVPANTWGGDDTSIDFGEVELKATTLFNKAQPYCKRRLLGVSHYHASKFAKKVNLTACDKMLTASKVNINHLRFDRPYHIDVYGDHIYLGWRTNHPFITAILTINSVHRFINRINDDNGHVLTSAPSPDVKIASNGSFINKNGHCYFIFAPDYHLLTEKVSVIYIREEHRSLRSYVSGSEKFYYITDVPDSLGDINIPSRCASIMGVSVSPIVGTPLPSRYKEIKDYIKTHPITK